MPGEHGEVERPDPDVIAGQHQPPFDGIPDRAGERTAQAREPLHAPLLVDVQHQFVVSRAAQSMPEYAGRTALIVTTHHGRGATTKDWMNHGRDVPAAEQTWIAVLGAGVPALGVRRDVAVSTSQIAATVASLAGENFNAASPRVARPLPLRK